MPLSHVCVWDADIGYKRISLESACKMYPNGASAKSGYFVCELCAQNVLLTAPGVNVRHFRHDPSSPNKECDERQAHFDPLYGRRLRNLNSHLMPLRITVAKESFALQMGFFCPPDSEARCDKIRITTNSGKAYEYSFERIERGGTIIPTYSFPKNVVSTYISGIDGKVKYQVERGLDVAIGEYAPGRAIVVDKTTYQIGGLYYPGGGRTEQTAYSPARAFIQDASYCKNISTCTECGWFGLDEDHPHKCPFCGNDKLTHMLPMLRPWGFAPRDAKAIEQAQLSEEYTATQQPLYSTLPDADDVVAIKGYSNTRMAVRPNQRIIMLNKGIGDKGFTICCDCGAAMPGDDPSVLKDIMRPYRSKFLRTRCKHNETKNVNLGYDFITDMLMLEIALDRQQVSMDLAKNSWLNRAGQSLAEALRLSACQELDIEFTELVTGFRVRQNQKGDFIDIYLYDSLSSGAGYAVSIEASIQQLLIKTRELLSSCNCDSACHKCLKHYRNQYVHGLLDRSAALDLLTWAEKGVRSPMLPVYEQRNLLQSVEQILQFSGVHIDFDHEPIEAESFHGKKRIVVYPAMWARPTEKNMVFVSDSYLKYAKPYALKTIVGGL